MTNVIIRSKYTCDIKLEGQKVTEPFYSPFFLMKFNSYLLASFFIEVASLSSTPPEPLVSDSSFPRSQISSMR